MSRAALVGWFLLLVGMSRCTAQAQSDEELLANICVHEAGWDSPNDCWGIYAVLANQAQMRHTTWQSYLRAHSRTFWYERGAHAWAHRLRDQERLPPGFPAGWSNPRPGGLPSRREAYHALVVLAYEILRTPPVCGATAWGSRADYASGRFAVEHRGDFFHICNGPTRNLFSSSQ